MMLAVVIAVASVSSVGFFTDRIAQALAQQANALLGGDAVIAADHPPRAEWRKGAETHHLKTAETLSFLSMSIAGERNQLAEVKAVSANYPLRGELRISPKRFASDTAATAIPAPGTDRADPRLLGELGIEVGDRLQLGNSHFTVSAVVSHEPDRGGSLFSIAPRLLKNRADIEGTGLLQPGSRVQYRLLVAGERAEVQAFRRDIEKQLGRGGRIVSVEDARPEMRSALERAHQFLGLASTVSVMLAGGAIAAATRRFVARHLDHVAILRALGATQSVILRIYLWQMLSLALISSAGGVVAGYFAQRVLAEVLGSLAAAVLPAPSWLPVAAGMAAGLVTVLGFAVPPLLHLKRVPTVRVSALTAAGLLMLLRRAQGRLGGVWRRGVANMVRRARGRLASHSASRSMRTTLNTNKASNPSPNATTCLTLPRARRTIFATPSRHTPPSRPCAWRF